MRIPPYIRAPCLRDTPYSRDSPITMLTPTSYMPIDTPSYSASTTNAYAFYAFYTPNTPIPLSSSGGC